MKSYPHSLNIQLYQPSVEYSPDDRNFVWRTNFESMYALTCMLHPLLKRNNSSSLRTASVINISSVAGVVSIKSGTLCKYEIPILRYLY